MDFRRLWQEYRADELACQLAGSVALIDGLKRIYVAAEAFTSFWDGCGWRIVVRPSFLRIIPDSHTCYDSPLPAVAWLLLVSAVLSSWREIICAVVSPLFHDRNTCLIRIRSKRSTLPGIYTMAQFWRTLTNGLHSGNRNLHMPQKGRVAPASNSGLAGKINKITAIVVALTGLLTAIVHFRDSIPWLTPVATINVTPSPVNLDLGDKFQILATVKDSKENPLGKKVTWSSANPSVAAVANHGIATASGVGETTITASIGPIRGATLVHVRRVTVASVEVFPPTTTLQVADHVKFDGTSYDADGNALPGRLVRWVRTTLSPRWIRPRGT